MKTDEERYRYFSDCWIVGFNVVFRYSWSGIRVVYRRVDWSIRRVVGGVYRAFFVIAYGIYKNTYAITKRAREQERALKRRGFK